MLRAEVWLATTLISIGVIGGMLYNWPAAQTPEERDNPPIIEAKNNINALKLPAKDNIVLTPLAAGSPAISISGDEVEKGDNFLLGGNYDAAYHAYVKAANQNEGLASSPLLLRMAIASERMKMHKQAALLYQNTVKHSQGQSTRLLGLSGLSRVWISQGSYDQALELLSEMYLLYGTLEVIPDEIRLQIQYQVSEAAQRLYLDSKMANASEFEELEFQWCEAQMAAMLFLADSEPIRIPNVSAENEMMIRVLQRPTEDATLISIEASTPIMKTRALLQEISDQTELTFDVKPLALAALSSRTAKLQVKEFQLAALFDSLFAPLGLIWEQNGIDIVLTHQNESKAKTDAFRLAQALRSLRRIELEFPESPRRTTSNLHRGNILLLSGDIPAASNQYQDLRIAGIGGETAAKLNFNMAILDRVSGQMDSAIERLYFAVDQSLDHGIQAKGYSRIAQMHLENGDTEGAIYAARRGLALSIQPVTKEKTALAMAKAYLLRNDSYAANKVLFDNQSNVTSKEGLHLSTVYGAYARFLGLERREGMRDERMRLIIALSAIMPEDTENFIDSLLVARAYFAVGFTDNAIELSQAALSKATLPFWKRTAAHDLATMRFGAGELEEALAAYKVIFDKKLAPSTDTIDELGIRAQLHCADITLMLDRPDESLSHCQQLWKLQLDDEQKNQTLTLMGRAYQRLGRHHTAAVCFAGMVPKEEIKSEEATTQ